MPIEFNSIPQDQTLGLFYAEFNTGEPSTYSQVLKSLIIGQRILSVSTTDYPDNVPKLIFDAEQASRAFGEGSQLHLMVEAFRKNNPTGELWCLPVADPSGGVAATLKIIVSGEAASSSNIGISIGGALIGLSIAAGDSVQKTALAIVKKITDIKSLPVTASAVQGASSSDWEVTITAKNRGAAGNKISVLINPDGELGGQKLPLNQRISASSKFLSGGTGSPDISEAIKAIQTGDYEFIGCSVRDKESIKKFSELMNEETGRWSWLAQLYGHCYFCVDDDINKLIELGGAVNDKHITIIGMEKGVVALPDVILGAYLGRASLYLSNSINRPIHTGVLSDVSPIRTESIFTKIQRNLLAQNGIATLYTRGGKLYIENSATTYTKSPSGARDDDYNNSEIMHAMAYVSKYFRFKVESKYGRCLLAADGVKTSNPSVITPKTLKSEVIAIYAELEREGVVQGSSLFAQNVVLEINDKNKNRLDCYIPISIIPALKIVAFQIARLAV